MKRIVFALACLLGSPLSVHAEASTSSLSANRSVYISEIAWAGSSLSTSDEWIELCAAPGTDLSQWSLRGASTNALVLPSGSIVPESGAPLLSNYGDDDAKSSLGVRAHYVTTSVSLSNAQLFLSLHDASGALADVAGASGTPPFAGTSGSTKATMTRLRPLQNGDVAGAWTSATSSLGFDAGSMELGSPGTCQASASTPAQAEPPHEQVPADPIESPRPQTNSPLSPMAATRLSELYPAPRSGETEWIELVNPSGIGDILDGWTLEDGKGTATTLSGVLLPWSRLVISAPKGSLNNAGDLVVLKDERGRVLDGLAYGDWETSHHPHVGDIKKGESAIRIEFQDTFAVTASPTPNAANALTKNDESFDTQETAGETPSVPAAAQAAPPASAPAETKEAPQHTEPLVITTAMPRKSEEPAVKKPAAARYKGTAYSGTVAVPPGVYSKTRMYLLRAGSIDDLRLSKSTAARFVPGQKISFVAQAKEEAGSLFLLANPNSIKTSGSAASSTFATIDRWPDEAGGYRFTADLVALRADGAEVRLNGIEGDVALPKSAGVLKPGDRIEIQGFISPGARPRVVVPGMESFRLLKTVPVETLNRDVPKPRLPWPSAAAFTVAAGAAGTAGYLRNARLERLALKATSRKENTA